MQPTVLRGNPCAAVYTWTGRWRAVKQPAASASSTPARDHTLIQPTAVTLYSLS